ncbi:MAG: hypothetical protein KAV45_14280 [Calditrichia bacterium]|jgi:hypothetical protein|nr:hypothetical protein [Calditrichia bacterium]
MVKTIGLFVFVLSQIEDEENMSNQIKKTSFRIIIVILILQLSIGCSAIGYIIGSNIDESNTLIEINKIEQLESNTEIVIFLKSDNTISGVYEKVSNDSIQLLNGNVIALEEINIIRLANEPSTGKVVWTTIGVTVDILVIILLLYAASYAAMGSLK